MADTWFTPLVLIGANGMPRSSRDFDPGTCLHIVQRGDNRQQCFFSDDERSRFLNLLNHYCLKYGCELHAYVLMTNHVHLLLTLREREAHSRLMKSLTQRISQYLHWRHYQTGTMWDGRYRCCVVQQEDYLLLCQRYIELNPVRAGMESFPGAYLWSSYRCNAEGNANSLVTPHEVYLRLGGDTVSRAARYRRLFDIPFAQMVSPGVVYEK
ncbi:transposase [Pseudoduganella sp. UC29_106]|uniref:transposase n=1 Tax=Pseudoduganella sp. UC29_106 TaxID=3374553 RepID=UPI003757EAD4